MEAARARRRDAACSTCRASASSSALNQAERGGLGRGPGLHRRRLHVRAGDAAPARVQLRRRAGRRASRPTWSASSEEDGRPVARGEGLYWRYERLLKRLEDRVGSVVSASGHLYAVRRQRVHAVERRRAGTDDFLISSSVVKQGGRLAFDEQRARARRDARGGRHRAAPQGPRDEPRAAFGAGARRRAAAHAHGPVRARGGLPQAPAPLRRPSSSSRCWPRAPRSPRGRPDLVARARAAARLLRRWRRRAAWLAARAGAGSSRSGSPTSSAWPTRAAALAVLSLLVGVRFTTGSRWHARRGVEGLCRAAHGTRSAWPRRGRAASLPPPEQAGRRVILCYHSVDPAARLPVALARAVRRAPRLARASTARWSRWTSWSPAAAQRRRRTSRSPSTTATPTTTPTRFRCWRARGMTATLLPHRRLPRARRRGHGAAGRDLAHAGRAARARSPGRRSRRCAPRA